MSARLFLAATVASSLAVGHARADDSTVHVTGNGPAVLVQETPAGRVELCKQLPCDIKADPNGAYRFVSAPGAHVRESQRFMLPNAPRIDLDVDVRSEIRRVEGWVLIGVGSAAVIAGIVLMVVGHDMNQQVEHSGDVHQGVGAAAGIVAGLITLAWGAGDAARNAHSRVSATPSQAPSPQPPPEGATAPQGMIAPVTELVRGPALTVTLFSMRF
jgi:hypothetical protein